MMNNIIIVIVITWKGVGKQNNITAHLAKFYSCVGGESVGEKTSRRLESSEVIW